MIMYLAIYDGALQTARPIYDTTELHIMMRLIEKRIAAGDWDEDISAQVLFPTGGHLSLVDQEFRADGVALVPAWKDTAFVQECEQYLAPQPGRDYATLKKKWEEYMG